MRVQHNIMAMNAYRNYTNNVSAMKKNLEKLSSGYKINRAGDDAAGLAISEKMRAQITGLKTAQKNAKDGISLVQTAEGALTEVHDMLNRMVELATQSANGTYESGTDRTQLQKEIEQLKDEINRIADSANFNGIKLLDGSMAEKTAVMGETNLTVTHVKDGQLTGKPQQAVFTVDLRQMEWTNTASDAADTETVLKLGTKTLAATISIKSGGGKLTGAEYADAFMKKLAASDNVWTDANNNKWDVTNKDGLLTFTQKVAKEFDADTAFELTVTNKAKTEDNHGNTAAVTVLTEGVSAAGRVYAQGTFDLANANIVDGTTLKIGDTTYTFAVGKNSKYKDAANVVDLTDQTKAVIDDNAELSKIAAERLSKVADGNKNFFVETDGKTSTVFLTEKEGGVDYDVNNLGPGDDKKAQTKDVQNTAWAGLVKVGKIDAANSTNGLMLQIGDTAEKFNQLRVSVEDCHAAALGIADIDVSNQESAAKAIDAIKAAINKVSDVRGTLGATQNRLDHTINNLSVMTENIQDAESTIRDTDIAEEMMAYTKNNILIQSAQAMLAQANQVPQGVLQLLG